MAKNTPQAHASDLKPHSKSSRRHGLSCYSLERMDPSIDTGIENIRLQTTAFHEDQTNEAVSTTNL